MLLFLIRRRHRFDMFRLSFALSSFFEVLQHKKTKGLTINIQAVWFLSFTPQHYLHVECNSERKKKAVVIYFRVLPS